jgi:hypothetical protein
MSICGSRRLRWVAGTAVGVTCLFIGDGASLMPASALAAQAKARHPIRVAGVARREHWRALLDGVVQLNIGYSAPAGSFYGYAPGTYGGPGCHPGAYGVLVCPP